MRAECLSSPGAEPWSWLGLGLGLGLGFGLANLEDGRHVGGVAAVEVGVGQAGGVGAVERLDHLEHAW